MTSRRLKVAAAVVLICLLGGCVDVTMTTTVDSEGEIEEVRAEAEMSQEVTVNEVSYMTTRVTDNETVVFTESLGDNVGELDEFTYRVEIPGKVTETDAAEIEDGSVAVWELHETNPERVYVNSEIEERSWLGTIALVLGVIGVAMVGVAA